MDASRFPSLRSALAAVLLCAAAIAAGCGSTASSSTTAASSPATSSSATSNDRGHQCGCTVPKGADQQRHHNPSVQEGAHREADHLGRVQPPCVPRPSQ